MTQAALSKYQDLLQKQLAELRNARHNVDGIAVLRSADGVDEAQYRLDRDLAIVSMEQVSTIERGVVMSLARIQQGTFGICTNCGGNISRRRLDALPWTPLCVDCQEACEAGPSDFDDTLFPDAA